MRGTGESEGVLRDEYLEREQRDAEEVLASSGWADGYSNAVKRLLSHVGVPRKGLIGPWSHKLPHTGKWASCNAPPDLPYDQREEDGAHSSSIHSP